MRMRNRRPWATAWPIHSQHRTKARHGRRRSRVRSRRFGSDRNKQIRIKAASTAGSSRRLQTGCLGAPPGYDRDRGRRGSRLTAGENIDRNPVPRKFRRWRGPTKRKFAVFQWRPRAGHTTPHLSPGCRMPGPRSAGQFLRKKKAHKPDEQPDQYVGPNRAQQHSTQENGWPPAGVVISLENSRSGPVRVSRHSDPVRSGYSSSIAVGMLIAEHPPHRSEYAQFRHSAPTLGA
jgi:hypothetical protein